MRAIDLADPDLYATGDPHAAWGHLRAVAPVWFNPEADGPGFWAVTGYAPAVEVYRQPDVFSSEDGIVLRAERWKPDPAGGRMLVLTDPPRHTKVRALVNRTFSPRTVAQLQEPMARTAAELVAAALARGTCEAVDDLAARLPVMTTCALMGVPRADWELMYTLTRRAFGAEDEAFRTDDSARVSAARAHSEIMHYYAGLIAERRRQPGTDLVSALATGRVDDELLTTKEILMHCDNLLVAGHETVRHATAGGMLAFIDHPEQWTRMRQSPELLDTAVEEILRWTSPGMHVLRTARRDVELHGCDIRTGDAVTVWNPSANRDATVFQRPDHFDVGRTPNRHLALGVGEHYCLGASMARLELRTMFAALSRSVRRMNLAGPVERLRSRVIGGYRSLPVELCAA